MKLFGVFKKIGLWATAGFSDRFSSRLCGHKCKIARHVVSKLDECEPWTDHLEETAIDSINLAMKNKDFETARIFMAFGVKEGASRHCVEIANLAIDLISSGSELTFELFTCME